LRSTPAPPSPARRALAILATFHFVCFAWVLFRAPTFADATLVLRHLTVGAWTLDHVAPKVILVLVAAFGLHVVPRTIELRARDRFTATPAFVQGLVLAAAAIGLHLASALKPEPFVYGQF
jgi:alginate O-acetyltransferase complex protein AlgI